MQKYLKPVEQTRVKINDSFISNLMQRAADEIIPYQWKALNDMIPDAAPSYCIRNMKAAAHLIEAPHGGCVFQDSDIGKWIEAASYMLMWRKDPETEKNIDSVIELMEKAQLDDGYLDTYYILTDIDKRFTNLRDNHELYCVGHLLEGAIAYFKATQKHKFLDIMIKYIDLIISKIGPEEDKIKGYPGHEEIELALIKLYELEGDDKYLKLASYFIDERGKAPSFFDSEAEKRGGEAAWKYSVYEGNVYYQAHKPVREQKSAVGHAVRQLYLLCGMADTARENHDSGLYEACERMWKDITRKQMYITGALGQTRFGEAFTFDYDLPNDTVYGETCASVAMLFFAQRMMRFEPKGEYGDVMDTLLYNGTISGMNLEGNRFFYVNPLECWPERQQKSQIIRHIHLERQKWLGCACCPPNLARMICQLPGYVFYTSDNTAFVNLFTSCDSEIELNGGKIKLSSKTEYPYEGKICLSVKECFDGAQLALRLPGWVKGYSLSLNGSYTQTVMDNGYLYIDGIKAGDEIEYVLDMPVSVVRAHPKARADIGKVAVRRGPIVYCLEEADNGKNLSAVTISAKAEFKVDYKPDFLGGAAVLSAPAKKLIDKGWDEYELYADAHEPVYEDFTATFIPYYAWNNRGVGEMIVWIREM